MSKINELIADVMKYPAVGKPILIRSGGVFWRGCVWINKTQTLYTGNMATIDAANDAARDLIKRYNEEKNNE